MDESIGQKTRRTTTVTQGIVTDYAKITGDDNPLHFDTEFTSRTRSGCLMAQGSITTSLLHAFVAMDMPGPGRFSYHRNGAFHYRSTSRHDHGGGNSHIGTGEPPDSNFVVQNQSDEEVLRGEATVYQASPSN